MSRTILGDRLSPEEIIKIASSGYNRNTRDFIMGVAKSSDIKIDSMQLGVLANKLTNLSGPKTLDGRIRSLLNLKKTKSKNDKKDDFNFDKGAGNFLDNDELGYFEARKAQYVSDFSINESSDLAILDEIVYCEVRIYRCRKAEKAVNSRSFDDEVKKIASLQSISAALREETKHLKSLLESLGVDRKKREGAKDHGAYDLANASIIFELNMNEETKKIKEQLKIANIKYEESQKRRIEELRVLGFSEDGGVIQNDND